METRQEILAALQELETSRQALEALLKESHQRTLAQICDQTLARLAEESLQRYELVDYFQAHGGIHWPVSAAPTQAAEQPPVVQASKRRRRSAHPEGEAMRKPTKPAQHFALKTDHTKIWTARGATPLWMRDACDAAGFDWSKKEGRLLFAEAHMEPVGTEAPVFEPEAPIDPTPLPLESEEDFTAAA